MTDPESLGPHEGEERERLDIALQNTRFVLLQNILGHPSQLLSLKEFDKLNPSKSKETIYQHLERLAEADIITVYTLAPDRRKRDRPYKFYGVSDENREFSTGTVC